MPRCGRARRRPAPAAVISTVARLGGTVLGQRSAALSLSVAQAGFQAKTSCSENWSVSAAKIRMPSRGAAFVAPRGTSRCSRVPRSAKQYGSWVERLAAEPGVVGRPLTHLAAL